VTTLVELIKKLLRDVVLFVRYAGGLKLRGYQEAVVRAVVHSVLHRQGLSFVVNFKVIYWPCFPINPLKWYRSHRPGARKPRTPCTAWRWC
jgi:hypothetical protein